MSQRHPGKIEFRILGSEIPPYICNFNKPGTTTVVLRVDTAPHGVETPTPLADC